MVFYSVKYRSWGADIVYHAWFDNVAEANQFASSHGGEIKKHVYKTGKNIQAARNMVDFQRLSDQLAKIKNQ